MSLYWPEGNVAIEIVDDPTSQPFDSSAHPEATVIPITCAQLESLDGLDEIARALSQHLGQPFVEADEETRRKRVDLCRTLFGPDFQ